MFPVFKGSETFEKTKNRFYIATDTHTYILV